MYKKIEYPGSNLKFDYYVNEEGNVWSRRSLKDIIPFEDKDGYLRVRLTLKNGKRRNIPVHRLVLMMFNPINEMMELQVNHLDGNKHNNHLSNLEWCNCQENITHAVRLGLRNNKGEHNYFHKITEADVLKIRQLHATGNYTYRKLGKMFGLYEDHISHIVRGMVWTHVV